MPTRGLVIVACLGLPAALAAGQPAVTIRTDFPGGNVVVVKNDGDTVRLAPDLRGGPNWFYWHFEAEAACPGRVTFVFADPPRVSTRGPAVSHDGGASWQWLGADAVQYARPATGGKEDSFTFAFTKAGQKVRLAVAIPYLKRDLETFLARHAANPHLTRGVLTQTRTGRRPVELLTVGKAGPGVGAVLLTARHHACESMASYVLEGFLEEAMADSPAGVAFRRRYVTYAVPFVDTDGVEEGDQGKHRRPHDHNRDYGPEPIYPEVKAIQELGELRQVRYSLDLHCPFLRGDIHDAFHFVGLGLPHLKDNVNELTAWLKEERPPVAMVPINLMVDPGKPGALNPKMNSHHFGQRPRAVFAATLEVPYTQPKCPLDAAMARQYGAALLRAWVRTRFLTADPADERGDTAHAALVKLRDEFQKTYRGKPREAEALVTAHAGVTAPPVYRAEANNSLALLRFQQKQYAEAARLCEAVLKNADATTQQRATAVLLSVRVACADPAAKAADVEAKLTDALAFPYAAADHQAKALEAVADFHQNARDYESALACVRRQQVVAVPHDQGRVLNRTAGLLDRLGRPDDAVAARQEAVKVLRAQLDPVPKSVFGAQMTGDLFEALGGIPTATVEEKRAAAALVLAHPVASAALKAKVREALAELD